MAGSQDSIALLKSAVKLAQSKIVNSFLFTDNDIETRLNLLFDANNLLTGIEFYLEQGSLYGLDDALLKSILANNIEKLTPLNPEAI